MRTLLVLLALTAAALLALPALLRPHARAPSAALELADLLGASDTTGYARARRGAELRFPRDHGPHTDFQSEWWYLTGNLRDERGRRFGYQLTFFRRALSPEERESPSAWATRQLWMAHFALTDAGSGRFHARERFARGAVGLAGAQAQPWRVWLEDWSLESLGEESFPLRLRAATREAAIDLVLAPAKELVLHGEAGYSRKGADPGNASHYYSSTRMRTSGSVRSGEASFQVQGLSWLDREWSTSVLEEGVAGWDWLSLQLDDGRELMVYRLRLEAGGASPFGSGTLVERDGSSRTLAAEEIQLEVLGRWKSPASGATYPSAWRVTVRGSDLRLEVRPVIPAQELDLSVRYWEGAVDVTAAGAPAGHGYVELTGY